MLSQALIGLYAFVDWSSETSRSFAFEAYPMSSEAQKMMSTLNSQDFMKYFENDFANNGLSFSQSLHTEVLKRTIDMRTAFQLAPDPENLDYILKKSGL